MSSSRYSWPSRLSLLFLSAGMGIILTYQLMVTLEQARVIAEAKQRLSVTLQEQQGQSRQIGKERERFQAVFLELLELSKSSDLAHVIADKYNIRRGSQGAGATPQEFQ